MGTLLYGTPLAFHRTPARPVGAWVKLQPPPNHITKAPMFLSVYREPWAFKDVEATASDLPGDPGEQRANIRHLVAVQPSARHSSPEPEFLVQNRDYNSAYLLVWVRG